MDKANYYSTVDVAELGNLTVGLIHNRSSIVCRKTDECGDSGSKRFTIMYAVDGELSISNPKSTITLKKGQFVLIDNSVPRKMFVYNSVNLLLICVTGSVLQRYVHEPGDVNGQIMQEPLNSQGHALFSPLLSLWEHLKAGDLDEFYTSIGEELLHDIGATYARSVLHCRSRHRLRIIQRIKQYIECHLGDPGLSMESIASTFQISSRYLRSLFQGSERLPAYIQRRRIEESAKLLTNPMYQASSITEVALLCGFNSSTHFSRCFKEKFHSTPRNFRQRHLQMESGALPQDHEGAAL